MRGSTHVLSAVAVMYLIHPVLAVEQLKEIDWPFILGGVIGSLLPDSDHSQAPAGKVIPMHILYNHRCQVHGLWYMGVSSVLAGSINLSAGIGVALGYTLHLLEDLQTYMGKKKGLPYMFWHPFKH